MEEGKENKKESSLNIRIMLVIAVLMAIGIIVRWDFIKSEVGTVFNNMFPKQETTK